MKILIVNDYSTPTGGAEIYVLQLRTFLREAGHNALLFSSSVGTKRQRLADIECWGSRAKITSRLLQTFNPFAYIKLRRVLSKFKPDLIHLNLFLTQLSPAVLLAFKKTPVVYTAHLYKMICPLGSKLLPNNEHCTVKAGKPCLKNRCLSSPLWLIDMVQQNLIRRYLQYIDVILANSACTERFMQASGIPVAKVQSYFLSTEHQSLPFPSTAPTVCFVGRLVPEKGVAVLLHAMRHVANELPEARLLIVGDGKEKQRLQLLSKQLNLDNVVEFLGYIPPERLDEVWLRSHVQVVPSVWAEPFGLVAVEAMAVGRPVVATRGGGLEEIVVDGESGFLVSAGNVTELFSKLLTLLQDSELAQCMGKRGSEVIKQRMNNQEILIQVLEVYDSLLQSKQR